MAGHWQPLDQAMWSPGGRQVATASDDGSVRLWDAGTGEAADRVLRHRDRVWAVDWSPTGGRLATGSSDRTARITEGDLTRELDHQGAAVEAVSLSPDGGRVATGGHDAVLRVWGRAHRGGTRRLRGTPGLAAQPRSERNTAGSTTGQPVTGSLPPGSDNGSGPRPPRPASGDVRRSGTRRNDYAVVTPESAPHLGSPADRRGCRQGSRPPRRIPGRRGG